MNTLDNLLRICRLSESNLPEIMNIHNVCFLEMYQENISVYETFIKIFPDGAWGSFYDDKLVGYIFFHPYKNQTIRHLNSELTLNGDEDCMYLHEIAILPEYRTHYIPSRLLNEFDKITRYYQKEYQSLVSVQNSMEFWQKKGFSIIKKVDESEYIDGFLMAKHLYSKGKMLQTYEFATEKATYPKLLVLGAVHGNETAGTVACERLIEDIKNGQIRLLCGRLTLIPICNPEAYKKDQRMINENLNRVVKDWDNPSSYEQKLGKELAEKIADCDYLLDIHSTHNHGDKPFAFLDYPKPENWEIIKTMEVNHIITGWVTAYKNQNSISNFSTEACANYYGKNGITLECGYHKDMAAGTLAYTSVVNLLKKLEMIEGEPSISEKKIIKMTKIIVKKKEGHLSKPFKHMDFVGKGTIIAVYDDGEELKAHENSYILLPDYNASIGGEWYYFGIESVE